MNCKSDSIVEIAKALCQVQGVITNAKKDSENPFFKSSYADLASVWDAARIPLSANGLSVSQLPGSSDGSKVTITTILMHISGEWLCSSFEMPYIKQDPQAVGSAITYARRYALAAIIGVVADDDDDGNKAAGTGSVNNSTPTKTHDPDFPPEKDTLPNPNGRKGVSQAKAKGLHSFLGIKGIKDSYGFATATLGKTIEHFSDMTDDEAETVKKAALEVK
jgi:hypothetical protein